MQRTPAAEAAAHGGRHAHVVGSAVYARRCCESLVEWMRSRPRACLRVMRIFLRYPLNRRDDVISSGIILFAGKSLGYILLEQINIRAKRINLRCRSVDFGL